MNHSQKQTPRTSKGNNNDRSTIHKYSTFLHHPPAVLSNIIYNMSLTPNQNVTNNAIRTLILSSVGESISGFQPLVQIIELKNNKERCDMIVIISDGQYCIQGMVYPNLKNEIDDGITVNNIIQINDYKMDRMDTEDGMPICNILSYHIIDTNITETIGSPVKSHWPTIIYSSQLEREREDSERQREAEKDGAALVAEAGKDGAALVLVQVRERQQCVDNTTNTATTSTISSNMSSSPATAANCVICQVAASSQAIIPCGHYCLCDDCATILTIVPFESKKCPLCRKRIQSCLKIYQSKSS